MKDCRERISLHLEKGRDSSEGEDSELQWCDNVAYGSNNDSSFHMSDNHDRSYNTVPHQSRAQKVAGAEKKYATISTTTGKQYHEYAEVGKIRPSLFPRDSRESIGNKEKLPIDGYEPGDSLSSLSSRSKDSLGSQGGDDLRFSSVKNRIEYFGGLDSPKRMYPPSPYWRKGQKLDEEEMKAPLAKQEVSQFSLFFYRQNTLQSERSR